VTEHIYKCTFVGLSYKNPQVETPTDIEPINLQRNIQAHSSSGKAVSIKCSERMFVASGIQHDMCMRHIVICGLPSFTIILNPLKAKLNPIGHLLVLLAHIFSTLAGLGLQTK